MPRIYGITLPAGIDVIYNKTLKMYDVSVDCNVGKNRRFLTRKLKLQLKDVTKLYQIAYHWSFLSDPEKAAWQTAAAAMGSQNYALFTQDTIYRLVNGIAGIATPNIYHQYLVGHIEIGGVTTSYRIHQYHNVPWQPGATLDLNIHSNLSAAGPSPSVVLRLITGNYFGGKNVYTTTEQTIGLTDAWQTVHIAFPNGQGTKANYTVEVEFVDVQGDFWFDDYFVQWDGAIQNKDPFCDSFPKYWYLPDASEDVIVESVYPLGAAL